VQRRPPPPRPRRRERGERRERAQAAGNGAAAASEATEDSAEAETSGEKDRDTVKLFVNRGERSGIDEEDLRWALREGAVLPDEAVHDVRVLHRFSFVEVDPEQAERTVEFLDGTKLKGKEIRLEIAKS
jgi:ATP-dependent RNA helicase DeaD